MDRTIFVRPVSGGWQVLSPGLVDLLFLSGAKAEEKAKDLAERLCALGHEVRLVILDKEERLVATRRYFAIDPVA